MSKLISDLGERVPVAKKVRGVRAAEILWLELASVQPSLVSNPLAGIPQLRVGPP